MKKKFKGLKISRYSLYKMYKRAGIKRKVVVQKKTSKPDQADFIKRRTRFCRDEIKRLMEEGTKVYYLDECMFTVRTF